MDKIKQWSHKINLTSAMLEPELNAFAEQGWEIYKIWNVGYDRYEIVAYKEDVRKIGSGRLTLKDVPPPQEANMI